jgi:heme/copper-type cytochrome/quinol oxidase subunit 2
MDLTPFLAIGRDWWLPANFAVHGRETDRLFAWFLWITVAVLVGVETTLAAFLLRYRRRVGDARRARFTHGNRRAEIAWTAAAILILGGLALASKRVWDDYRSSPSLDDPARSKVLIIGQQFAWNVVYPGPDGRFGRYGVYPKPTDDAWPVGPDGSPTTFAGVAGPASLPPDRASRAINDYVDQVNPLGKDFDDPDGRDDDWQKDPGRPIYVPVGRPVEVELMSKDVIHDFFLPNFRAQLYAVPGMVGRFVFTPTTTTADLERASRQTVSVDALPADAVADIGPDSLGAVRDKTGWRYVDSAKKKRPTTIVRDGYPLGPDAGSKLRAAGITTITVHTPAPFEVVCAQLCGVGHSRMRGELVVLSQAEFDRRFPASPHSEEYGTTDAHR